MAVTTKNDAELLTLLQQGKALHQQGDLQSAQGFYDLVMARQEGHAEALYLSGLVAAQSQNPSLALQFLNRAIALEPRHAMACFSLGMVLHGLKRYAEAVSSFDRALAIQPDVADFHFQLGNSLKVMQQLAEAVHSYDRALALRPDFADCLCNRGNVLHQMRRFDAALQSYEQAISCRPGFALAHSNQAAVLQALARWDDAVAAGERATALAPGLADAHYNLGNALKGAGRLEAAVASFDRAIELASNHALAHANRGMALLGLNRVEEALGCLDRALVLKPDYAEALNNMGNALMGLNRVEEALGCLDRALVLKPDYADGWYNRGNMLLMLRRFTDALACYETVLRIRPDYPLVLGYVACCRCSLGQWEGLDALLGQMRQALSDGRLACTPWVLLSLIDDPDLHLQAAGLWAREYWSATPALGRVEPMPRRTKIHIAYVSGDFREHPVSFLTARLFELHDRSRFELTAVSFGADDGGPTRRRVAAAFDRFVDVRGYTDVEVARMCRQLGVHVAVDLMGYTQNCRTGIFAERCAPIQVGWLGYPGTMGAAFMDCIVADARVIDRDDLKYYTEKLICLPNSFLVTDDTRQISDDGLRRVDCGLPVAGFVYCCFTKVQKILPHTFAVWMRILQRQPDAVLWLSDTDGVTKKNLMAHAERCGVDGQRLVFCAPLPMAQHLERHRLADLWLDTWPYNAHSTASDALWAGLPVLTRCGRSFASRVAASLLQAVGLPELIAESNEEYEALAVALAQQPARLADLKARLAVNRRSQPLFDSERMTRDLEAAYVQVMERYWAGAGAGAGAIGL